MPPTLAIETASVETALSASIDPVLALRQTKYEALCAALATVKVADEDSYQAADKLLLSVLEEKDGLEAVRVAGPGALGAIARRLNAKFKPLSDLLETAEKHLKRQIGEFKLAQQAQQAVNYREAAAAHIVGDHTAASTHLAVASAAQTTTAKGTSVKGKWIVASIDAKAVPVEWKIPDEKRIAAHARNTPADVEPVPIEGVVFIQDVSVSKRRTK